MRRTSDDSLRCSFCRKSQEKVGKLISSPSDYPRAYICDECVAVCNYVIEDDQKDSGPEPEGESMTEEGRFAQHPLAIEFLAAAERWAVRDLTGRQANGELDQMRAIAARMLAES